MGVSQGVGKGKPHQFSENSNPQEPGQSQGRGGDRPQLIKPECGPTPGVGTWALSPEVGRREAPPDE